MKRPPLSPEALLALSAVLARAKSHTVDYKENMVELKPTLAQAMKVVTEEIQTDASYAWSWFSNLTASAHTQGATYDIALKSAAKFMEMLFDIDITKSERYQKEYAAYMEVKSKEEKSQNNYFGHEVGAKYIHFGKLLQNPDVELSRLVLIGASDINLDLAVMARVKEGVVEDDSE